MKKKKTNETTEVEAKKQQKVEIKNDVWHNKFVLINLLSSYKDICNFPCFTLRKCLSFLCLSFFAPDFHAAIVPRLASKKK